MKNLKKITAVVTAVIAVIVIILGVTVLNAGTTHSVDDSSFRYSATEYDAKGASFGADFYTYVYDASDIIVDELDEINKGMETVVKAQSAINENVATGVDAIDDLIAVVCKAAGMIIISIGLAILAYAVQCIGKAFAPVETVKAVEAAETVEEPAEEAPAAEEAAEV